MSPTGSSRDPWDLSWSERVGSWGSPEHDEPGKRLGFGMDAQGNPKAAPTPSAHRKTLLVTPHLPPSTLHEPLCPWDRSSLVLRCRRGNFLQHWELIPNTTLGTHELRHLRVLPQVAAAPGIPFPGTGMLEDEAAARGGVNHPNGTPTLSGVWLKGLMVALVFLADPLHRLLHEPRQVLRPRHHRRRLQRPLGESSSLGPPNCQYSSKLTQPDESPAFPHQLPAGGKMERLGAGGGALGA